MSILVTGAAGFIGFYLARRRLAGGYRVAGYDGMTPYSDVRLKAARGAELARSPRFVGPVGLLEEMAALSTFVETQKPDLIVHLAA